MFVGVLLTHCDDFDDQQIVRNMGRSVTFEVPMKANTVRKMIVQLKYSMVQYIYIYNILSVPEREK